MKVDPAAFFLALARRARYENRTPDPLAHAVQFLSESGETAEGRMLRKIIETLVSGNGEFDESDVWLLSARGLALANALVKAKIEGIAYTQEQWRSALSVAGGESL